MLSLTCITTTTLFTPKSKPNSISPTPLNHFLTNPIKITKTPLKPISSSSKRSLLLAKSSDSETYPDGETVSDTVQDEWLTKLPDKNKPLYAHSLPCIEAWLTSLGFYQSHDDLAVWFIHKSDWHAQLSLDLTDLYVRYLKSGPGNLEKDVERRFSYALSREDIENAVLGGP